jgi:hypothetical protein
MRRETCTSHDFNQFPVYAQLNTGVVTSDTFRAIASDKLYEEPHLVEEEFAFKKTKDTAQFSIA